MKKILLSFFTLFIVQTSFSQIDYDVMIDRLYSAADDSDGSGDEDPTWRVRLQDNAGGAVQTSNCFNTTHAYNSWWDINYVFFSATNSNASSFSSWMECWEAIVVHLDPVVVMYVLMMKALFVTQMMAKLLQGHQMELLDLHKVSIFFTSPCQWNGHVISIIGETVNGSLQTIVPKLKLIGPQQEELIQDL